MTDFSPQTHNIEFTCGAETCASRKGVFCYFFGKKQYGFVPYCMLFLKNHNTGPTSFDPENDYVLRLEECVKAYPSDKAEIKVYNIPFLIAQKATLEMFLDNAPRKETLERIGLKSRISEINQILNEQAGHE